MRRLWLVVWLAVVAWDGLLPHIEPTWPRLSVVALVAAGLLLIRRHGPEPWVSRNLAIALAVVCGLIAVVLPWPEGLGPLLATIGFAVAAIPRVTTLTRGNAWLVPASLGGLLTLLALLSHVYRYVESSYRDLPWAAPPLAFFYKILGIPAVADPPYVHVQGVGNLHTFDCTIEKLVGYGLAMFVAAGLALLAVLHGRRLGWKRPLFLMLLVVLFSTVRALALGLALDQVGNAAIYYYRLFVFGSLLPFVGLLALVLPPLSKGERAPHGVKPVTFSTLRPRRVAVALATAALTGICIAGALGFFDPGHKKPGRILIDEMHSNWEWSTVDLNTESYGVQTVYNYSELVRYLGHYFEIEANFDPITDALLAKTDVMILKTPTRPYDDAEVDALVRFVRRGGGLWLVGDHTNVFGMSTNLNMVAGRFGMRYRFDAVIDLVTFGRQMYLRPRLFAHPSQRHLPPILMATSCSMVGPAWAQRVMVGQSLLSDRLDYSVNAFFGDFLPDPSEPFGSMLQSLAVTYGKGRVLAFSDSTIFSNFFMFVLGKPELALGSINWLMHENRWAWVRTLFLAASVVGVILLILLATGLPRPVVMASLAVALLALAGTARALDAWVAGWSSLPQPQTPLPILAFDRGRTDYEVPDIADLPDESANGFHTFYVWTQRVGWMPTTRLFEDCLDESDAVVFINPRAVFEPDELLALRSYVNEGGGLFVMDSPHARHSSANTLLHPFGMGFEYAEVETVTVYDAATQDSLVVMDHVGGVTGGDAVLQLADSTAVVSQAQVGRGRVVAMCLSDNFSDAVFGTTSEVPDEKQLALYQIQFRIFGDLLRPEESAAVGTSD
jgi:hypothetical protein